MNLKTEALSSAQTDIAQSRPGRQAPQRRVCHFPPSSPAAIMCHYSHTATLCSILALVLLVSSSHALVDMELDARPPRGEWVDIGPASNDEMIELTFAVRQQNLVALEATLLERSDPRQARYGQWLSRDAVHALVAPRAADIAVVRDFLARHSVPDTAVEAATPNSDMIVARVSVRVAERLLDARYRSLRHTRTAHTVVRCTDSGYRLPLDVAAAIDFVAPTVRLPSMRGIKTFNNKNQNTTAPRELVNNPKSLRALYGVGETQGAGKGSKNRAAVTAFLEQHYAEASLAEFYRLFCSKQVPCGIDRSVQATVTTRGDGWRGAGGGVEAMLDIEYITALGAGVATEFWGFSGRSPNNSNNEPFLKWLQLVANTSDAAVPNLFSTSYGEDEDTVSEAWALRTNVEFQKTGARGISLLYASGDSGAAGDDGCKGSKFVPQWPSGSPYVTAVGGTHGGGATSGNEEEAVGLSSGGFSNRWARPSWQKEAVAEYKKTAAKQLPDAGKYNATGRGFPDISAQAVNFIVVDDLVPLPGVAGTSCASPTASGVITLLNELRLANNKPALGFLNPFIYQNMDAWNDIVAGSNGGCGINDQGFPAVKGWDAVTGAGTPNYPKLAKAVQSLR